MKKNHDLWLRDAGWVSCVLIGGGVVFAAIPPWWLWTTLVGLCSVALGFGVGVGEMWLEREQRRFTIRLLRSIPKEHLVIFNEETGRMEPFELGLPVDEGEDEA